MNLIKRFSWLLLILSVLMAWGCGGEQTGTDQPARETDKDRITITVNNGPKDTEPKEIERWELREKLFEEKYPDIDVVVEMWDYEPAVFMTRAAGDQLSDLVNTWATEAEVLLDNNLAEDITDILTSWEHFDEIQQILLKPFHRNGKYYAFPTSAYSMGLFYNKTLLRDAGVVDENGEADPPESWEEFVEAAKKINDVEKGISGFSILGGHHGRAGWHFLNWGWQGGGSFEEKINGEWKATFDGPGVARALQFVKDLRWKHDVLQDNVLADDTDIAQNFAAGRVGMFIGPANEDTVVALREKYEYDLDNLGIAALPEGPGGRYVQMGADLYIMKPGISEEKKKAAFQWCAFSVSREWKEAEWQLRKKQGLPVGAPYIPIFKGEKQKQWDEALEKYRNIPRFEEYQEEVVKYLKTEPPFYCQQLYKEVLGPAVQEVLTQEDADPRAILDAKAEMFQKRYMDKLKKE